MHRGPYMGIRDVFQKLAGIMTGQNLWGDVEGVIGLYFDDPRETAEADLRSMAGAILKQGVSIPEGLEEAAMPAGPVARLRFKGPYSDMISAYRHLFEEWLPASGREIGAFPTCELYLNSPMDTAPEELLTDIIIPLR